MLCRVVVATHPAGKKKSPVGVTRAGVVYELFFTNLPQHAFTACDVVELYLHRGAFEPMLSDEDSEQDPDSWCSHSAWGQEVLAGRVPMDLEPETRTGASAQADNHYARPSLLRLSPLLHHTPLLPLAMLLQKWVPHGRPVASRARILLSSPMERFGARQTRN